MGIRWFSRRSMAHASKTFSLTDTGLEVKYQTQEPITVQIPLLVDPDSRFTPGWAEKYVQQNTPGGIAWGLENGPMVSVQTEGRITMRAFNESLSLLNKPRRPGFRLSSRALLSRFRWRLRKWKCKTATSCGWNVCPDPISSCGDTGAYRLHKLHIWKYRESCSTG